MSIELVKEKFARTFYNKDYNTVYVFGELLGIEEEGMYSGKPHYIVLMKTERDGNKPLYVWVILPKTDESISLIKRSKKVFISGYMNSTYTFNNLAVSHTFIVPVELIELEDDVKIDKTDDFYLNYTVNNRVVLQGIINNIPWREYIAPANNYVTRFSIDFALKNNKHRSIYCTLWDTVNDVENLAEGQRIKIIGSFNLLKKERGLKIEDCIVVESKKNKLDSYVIVVQKIELIN